MEGKGLINDAQFGFQSGVGAIQQAAHLAARLKVARKKKSLVAFLDVEKAYDRAWKERILQRLHEKDVNRELLSMLQVILGDRTFCCRVGSSISTKRTARDGLPQGAPLSPMLYNVLVGDLKDPTEDEAITIFQYADDTAIMATGISWKHAKGKLERTLETVLQFCTSRRISINSSKTSVVKFGKKFPKERFVLFNRKPISIKTRGTYLGVTFNWNLDWKPHIRTRANIAERTLGKLYRILRSEELPLRTKTTIIKSIIQAQASYGEEIWAGQEKSDNRKQGTAMGKAMRTITGAPWFVRNRDLRSDLGLQELDVKAMHARSQMKERLSQDRCLYRRKIAGILT